MSSWDAWGPLAARYQRPGPRRVLALDGGGMRGLITLGVLEALEGRLRERAGGSTEFRLCQFFDLITGTSTGAIIAAGLARGMSVAEVLDFYQGFGREVFTKRPILERWKSLYGNGALQRKLQAAFGATTTLEPEHLRCLLLVVTRNATTDSAWPIFSNPWSKYNQRDRKDCNLRIPLWQIVRASTAAPVYFPPETIAWDKDDAAKQFVFVDGGTTAYNNPAFLAYRMVVGASLRPRLAKRRAQSYAGVDRDWRRLRKSARPRTIPSGTSPAPPSRHCAALMNQAAFDQDFSCRTIGRCVAGQPLDRELGDLIPRSAVSAAPLTRRSRPRLPVWRATTPRLTQAGSRVDRLRRRRPGAGERRSTRWSNGRASSEIGGAVAKHHLDIDAFGHAARR